MSGEPNLRQLARSRTKLKAGDIFAMQIPDGRYLFGRVVLANLPRGSAPMPTSNLVYFYDVIASEKAPPPVDSLSPDSLLIPPQFINRLPWSKGYFENVAWEPLRESDLLAQHCFWDAVRKIYRDELGQVTTKRTERCGEWGLASYRMIDDLLSEALGISRVPA